MCCILEIGLLIYGIIALVTGKMKFSGDKVVQGTPARLLGIVAMLPFPLAFMAGVIIGIVGAAQGNQPGNNQQVMLVASGVEAVIVLVIAAIVFGVGFSIGKPEVNVAGPYPYGQLPPPYGYQPGNAPPMPPSNNPYQPPYPPPPQQGGPFDPFRQ